LADATGYSAVPNGTFTAPGGSLTAAGVLTIGGSGLTGSAGFTGSSSGTATITAQASAGTPTLTLPNASGTFAISVSSPLVLNATTGNLTCPTCVVSGGALFTLNAGTNFGITTPGAITSGSTVTIGATTDTLRFAALGLGMAAPATGVNIGNALVAVASNGQMALGAISTTDGAVIQGQGSARDFTIQNKTPATVCSVATGTTTLNCATVTLTNALTVANGGTGQQTLTNHGVLVGAGTGAITQLAVGATNTALLGNTGADPSFGAVPNAALANSSITIAIGTNVGISVSGCAPVALGGTCTIGATTDTVRHASLGLGMAAPATGINIGNAIVNVSTNGQAALGASATAGAQWQGQGSSTDIVIQNKTPATVCSVATGTTTFNCVALQINGSSLAGANPTNPGVNLTGANGSAVTYLRSDAVLVLDQTIAPTWTGQHIWTIARTITSATGAALDDHDVAAATTTITGNTGSPITRLAKSGFYRPTITDSSAVTVTDAATVYIDNSPLAAGSVTITNAWSLLVGSGSTKLQATTLNAALTYGGVTLANSVTGTGSMVLGTAPTFTTSITSPIVYGGSAAGSTLTLQSTSSGSPSGDKVTINSGGSARVTVLSGGNTGIGTETNPQYPLVASGNAATGITSISGTNFLVIGNDSNTTTVSVDNYQTTPSTSWSSRLSGGTAASPLDTPTGATFNLLMQGRANGAFTTSAPAKITFSSINNWGAADTSSQIDFFTTPSGSTTRANVVRIQGSGGLSISSGTLTDPGAGGLFANGAVSFTGGASGGITLTTLTTDSGLTNSRTLCQSTSGGVVNGVYFGSGAAGVCKGTSGLQYKRDITDLRYGLNEIVALRPVTFHFRAGWGDDGAQEQVGFIAQDVARVIPGLPELVGHDPEGEPSSLDYMGLLPITIRAVQQLKAENDALRAEIETLKRRVAR